VVGGVVTKRGDPELPLLIVLVWGAAVSGDVAQLLLRRRFGRPFLDAHGAQLQIRPEHVDRVGGFLRNRYGGKAVLVGGPQLYTHSRRFIRGPRGGHERQRRGPLLGRPRSRFARDGPTPGSGRLFISRRAVEYDLHRVFARLDISARNQLHRVPPSDPGTASPIDGEAAPPA